jgi:hypothetical protein
MDGKYQTRDGRAVRILCVDMKSFHSHVVGLVTDKDGTEFPSYWDSDGTDLVFNRNGADDLVPVPTKHEAWCIIDSSGPLYTTRELAEKKHAELHVWPSSHVAHVTWED